MDEIDKNIISFLQKNGRISNNEIAAKLSISEGTVRNRIKKLAESDFLEVKGLLNPRKIIDRQIVYLCLNVSPSKDLKRIAGIISEMEDVRSVSIISGRYDILVELFIEPSTLIEFISNQLGRLDSVTSTESFMTLDSINKWI